MILTSTIPAGSSPLAGNSWAIRGLLPIMRQWSIGEQEAAHKLQTDYPQDKELIIFPGGSHWKQQQKFSILMKDSTLETEKQKTRKFSRSLNPIQTPYDSRWNWCNLTHWKKNHTSPILLGSSLSCTKIQNCSYSPHGTHKCSTPH